MIPRTRGGQLVATAYVVAVAGVGTFGFATESTAAILLAGLLALPSSVPGVIGFYLAVALVALVPGADPDSSSGSACSPPTACDGSTTGDAAAWFPLITSVIGILALTAAALLNVVVLSSLVRGSASASGPSRSEA